MNLTITVSNVVQAQQAVDILRAYVDLSLKPVAAPAAEGTPIDDLELTVRSTNCLRAEGITTVEELVCWTGWELLRLPHLGRHSLDEIENVLRQRGLKLGTKHRRIPTHP